VFVALIIVHSPALPGNLPLDGFTKWQQWTNEQHQVTPIHLDEASQEVGTADAISEVNTRIMVLSCFYYPAAWGDAICFCPQI
jgi:hypothetical protein